LAAFDEFGDVIVALIRKWLAVVNDFSGVRPRPQSVGMDVEDGTSFFAGDPLRALCMHGDA
jgi:hypothetical protein